MNKDNQSENRLPILTLELLKQQLDVSYSTIKRMMNEGLPYYKRGHKIFFHKDKIQNYLDQKYQNNK